MVFAAKGLPKAPSVNFYCGIQVEPTVLFEQGVRLQERGHRALEFHSLFCCLAICGRQVPNIPHRTAALIPLRGSDLLPSLRRAHTLLHASTSNCGIRVQGRMLPG